MTFKTSFQFAALAAILTGNASALAQPGPEDPGPAPVSEAPLPEGPADLAERIPELTVLEVKAGGLTADETARRALAASTTVSEKRAQVDSANARIRQTMTQFFPQLMLRASYTRLSPLAVDFGEGALVGARTPGLLTTGPCPGGAPGQCVLDAGGQPVAGTQFAIQQLENNYALVATLSVPISDYVLRLSHAAASSSASRESAKYSLEAEKLKVQSDARVLYYNWLRAVSQVPIAERSLERTRARLEDARTAFEVGTTSRADLLRLEALVANTELAVEQAIALRALANSQLSIVMDDRQAPALYPVGQGIVLPRTDKVSDGATRRFITQALGRRLELRAVDAATRSLSRGAKAVRAGALPRVDALGDVTYANPNPRFFPPTQEWNATWSVGVAATWNVSDIFGSRANADDLDAQVQGTLAQRQGLRAAITQEVVSAQLDLYKAHAAARTNVAALRAAEEAYRVTTDLYRAGQSTATDVIAAEVDLMQAKLGELNANIDIVIASVRLRHAVGDDISRAR